MHLYLSTEKAEVEIGFLFFSELVSESQNTNLNFIALSFISKFKFCSFIDY